MQDRKAKINTYTQSASMNIYRFQHEYRFRMNIGSESCLYQQGKQYIYQMLLIALTKDLIYKLNKGLL